MSIKSQKDFVSGLMFTAIGAGFAWNSALSYDIGSASQMGPGYFPLVLGLVLVLLGGFIMFFARPEQRADVIERLLENGGQVYPVSFTRTGAQHWGVNH